MFIVCQNVLQCFSMMYYCKYCNMLGCWPCIDLLGRSASPCTFDSCQYSQVLRLSRIFRLKPLEVCVPGEVAFCLFCNKCRPRFFGNIASVHGTNHCPTQCCQPGLPTSSTLLPSPPELKVTELCT